MKSAIQWSRRFTQKRAVFTVASSALGISVYSSSTALRNDSDAQWPKAQISTNELQEEQSASRGKATVDSNEEDVPLFGDTHEGSWPSFSSRFAAAGHSLSSIKWSNLGDKIADQVLPAWAQSLPEYVAKLQGELYMRPGSLAEEVWHEAQDPYVHPEIAFNAKVRVGKDLCAEELAFIQRRKKFTTSSLARYLDIADADIHPEDVPTIAICGSGGGLRALVAGASSCLSAQEAGLFDCATYTAGVSGSCWFQTLYNSSLGGRRHNRIIEHLKKRIGVHIAYPPSFLELLTRAPTNKYILSGTVEKLKGDPKADFGLVDAYGLLLATRLLIPQNELGVDDSDLKLSNQRKYVQQGANPLPIYAAVRHEIPIEEERSEKEKAQDKTFHATKEKAKREAWFQWFEFTPFELWCEEFDAGIPSWSIGRHFQNGKSVVRDNGLGLPEMRIPFLMGIWGSAFCATLAHYYKEIRPLVKGLAGFGGIDNLLEGKNEDLVRMHPIEPGKIPNFALGMKGQLPLTCSEGVYKNEYLELMDAGMSNNLPLYPLLRRGRDIDIIICFDASADIKEENWLAVADGYVKSHGIKGWPVGAGWPKRKDETKKELDAADATTAQQAAGKIAELRERRRSSKEKTPKEDRPSESTKQEDRPSDNETKDTAPKEKHEKEPDADLTYCNIWTGPSPSSPTTKRITPSSPSPSPKTTNTDSPPHNQRPIPPTPGITLIYLPLLPNPKTPGVDPSTSPYLSTWNFIYTPEQIDKVVSLAKANFDEGEGEIRRAVRGVWEGKRARRLEGERGEWGRRERAKWRGVGNIFE